MDEAILDTDVMSEVLKARNQQVLNVAQQYLAQHQRLAFSAITLYEILRGLRASQATRGLNTFFKLVGNSDVLPVSLPVLFRAADLWADAGRGGYSRNDADLIIAATALESGRVLVTGNGFHFSWISGLSLADWRAASP
jgi:predicted nucleic acid-binding protein